MDIFFRHKYPASNIKQLMGAAELPSPSSYTSANGIYLEIDARMIWI